ncbi:MAG: fibrobacter succinogenes major paralogous domain-containing protein, partial [Prolixibacteraceae bacterium]|nr:fibrobacter succinogenes major paralogous domain-containing protein [Prolixibacteraceae bacterium]
TVKIGDRWWFAENLAWLPAVSPPTVESETNPYYYVYGYQGVDVEEAKATQNFVTYGVLYNWPAATGGVPGSDANPSGVQGACPAGWHLPGDTEWKQLEMFLGMNSTQADGIGFRGTDQGTQMKAQEGWIDLGNGSNSSGFTALPGGVRGGDLFSSLGGVGHWWSASEYSATQAWKRRLNYDNTKVQRYYDYKDYGYSIRCVRDDPDTLTIYLNPGWNLFSVNVVPDNSDLKELFDSLISQGLLVMIVDESGNNLEDQGEPEGWTNDIGNISITEGYKIKVLASCGVDIAGMKAEYPLKIPLKSGWNYIGFPCREMQDGLQVVQQLIDRQTLVKLQDETGAAIENLGEWGGWKSMIGTFVPGKGYWVKMAAADTLTIDSTTPLLRHSK